MQTFGVALQTALPRACNVVAKAGARRGQYAGSALLRNGPCTLCFLGHVP